MERNDPERIVLELVLAGIVNALARSRAASPAALQETILDPLYARFRMHQDLAHRAQTETDAARERRLEVECASWHSLFASVLGAKT